jgi:protein gp37
MGLTKIQWARWTFNMWRGCVEVSPGCDHCYARELSKRNPAIFGTWGVDGERVIAAESYWRMPLKWDRDTAKDRRQAHVDGQPFYRPRVFCASLADWLEQRRELVAPRERLASTIEATEELDWLLLTKRPQLFAKLCPERWRRHGQPDGIPDNVWFGFTAEDDERLRLRTHWAVQVHARVIFISAEPLLGPLPWLEQALCDIMAAGAEPWVIVGGESGGGARPFAIEWCREIVQTCRRLGVPVFVKQLGVWPMEGWEYGVPPLQLKQAGRKVFPFLNLVDAKHGGDISEFPEDVQVREVPILSVV